MWNCPKRAKKCGCWGNNCSAPAHRLPPRHGKHHERDQIPNFAQNWTDCFKRQTNPSYGSNCSVMIVGFMTKSLIHYCAKLTNCWPFSQLWCQSSERAAFDFSVSAF